MHSPVVLLTASLTLLSSLGHVGTFATAAPRGESGLRDNNLPENIRRQLGGLGGLGGLGAAVKSIANGLGGGDSTPTASLPTSPGTTITVPPETQASSQTGNPLARVHSLVNSLVPGLPSILPGPSSSTPSTPTTPALPSETKSSKHTKGFSPSPSGSPVSPVSQSNTIKPSPAQTQATDPSQGRVKSILSKLLGGGGGATSKSKHSSGSATQGVLKSLASDLTSALPLPAPASPTKPSKAKSGNGGKGSQASGGNHPLESILHPLKSIVSGVKSDLTSALPIPAPTKQPKGKASKASGGNHPLASILHPLESMVSGVVSDLTSALPIPAPTKQPKGKGSKASAGNHPLESILHPLQSMVSGVVSDLTSALPIPAPTKQPKAKGSKASGGNHPLESILHPLESMVSGVVSDLTSMLPPKATGGSNPLKSDLHPIESMLSGIVSDVTSMLPPKATGGSNPLESVLHPIESMLSGVISDVTSMLPPKATGGSNPLESVLHPIESMLSGVVSDITSILPPKATGGGQGPLQSLLHGVVSDLTSMIPQIIPTGMPSPNKNGNGNDPLKSILNGVPGLLSSLISDVAGVPTLLPTALPVASLVSAIVSDLKPNPTNGAGPGPIGPIASLLSSLLSDLPLPGTKTDKGGLGGILPLPTGILPSNILPTGILPTGILHHLSGIIPQPTGGIPPTGILPNPTGVRPNPTGILPNPTGVLPNPTVNPPTFAPPIGAGRTRSQSTLNTVPPAIAPSQTASITGQTGTDSRSSSASAANTETSATNTGASGTESASITSSGKSSSSDISGTSGTSGTGGKSGTSGTSGASGPSGTSDSSTESATGTAASQAKATQGPLFSIKPTGTNTATTQSIGASIQMQPSFVRSGVETDTNTKAASFPSSMPQIIQPPGGMVEAPPNTTLVQIGFQYPLNYPFVANTPGSANQIFYYLPIGLSWALEIDKDQVKMHSLQPYNTMKDLGYVTTLALAYIPSGKVDTLQLDIHTAVSRLYRIPDDSTSTLMTMLNPGIALQAGSLVGGSDAFGPTGQNAMNGPGQPGDPMGTNGRKKIQGTSVGIGVGVVAGAAVYGAAMFYVARRYKRRKQKHIRTPSVMDGSPHSSGHYGSMMGAGALTSGGRSDYGYGHDTFDARNSRGSDQSSNDRSVRDAGISGPLMAENSLGWH